MSYDEEKSERIIIKHKRNSKSSKEALTLSLDRVFGLTSKNRNSIVLQPKTGEIVYPTGSVVVFYNPKINKQSKFIFSPNRRLFSCLK